MGAKTPPQEPRAPVSRLLPRGATFAPKCCRHPKGDPTHGAVTHTPICHPPPVQGCRACPVSPSARAPTWETMKPQELWSSRLRAACSPGEPMSSPPPPVWGPRRSWVQGAGVVSKLGGCSRRLLLRPSRDTRQPQRKIP